MSFWADFTECIASVKADPSLRVILISNSQQRHFSTGLDSTLYSLRLISVMSLDKIVSRNRLEFKDTLTRMQRAFNIIEECGKPVIVAIHGACIGAGVELACACDIRFCTRDVQFALKEVDLGIVADLGGLQRLGKCIGSKSFIRDVCFTGRVFGADEAMRQGFVNGVYESKEVMMHEALLYAESLAIKQPDVLLGIKQARCLSSG